ncbi:unnamed protein product [Sphagnum jensenii]|uniref:K+ potassium transporter integral membrane domain-containing protein n=1 Tax=Sphagnum jensenii TaxID=128206 RepID=A0ABP0X431_9BRYO
MTTISDPVRFLLGGWDVTEFLNLLADMVTIISLVILVGLFSMQQFGTARVGFMFAPIFLLWFVSIGLIGIYNIINHDKSIFHAFSPLHIVCFWVVYPCLLLAYLGQAAYLLNHPENAGNPFYKSIPGKLFPLDHSL